MDKNNEKTALKNYFDYNPVVRKTRKSNIRLSISNSFSGMFLTMLSITQGVALGFLFNDFLMYFLNKEIFCKFFITLFLIIIIWHSYFWLSAVAIWTPLIWDSFFMFITAAIELITIKCINNDFWYFAVPSIGIIGSLQYFYNAWRLPDELWSNDAKEYGRWVREYKQKRGFNLLLFSFNAIGFSILTSKSQCVDLGLFMFAAENYNIKLFVNFLFFFGAAYAIFKHLKDQKKTLKELRES